MKVFFIIILCLLESVLVIGQHLPDSLTKYPTCKERLKYSTGYCIAYLDKNLQQVNKKEKACYAQLIHYYGKYQFDINVYNSKKHEATRIGKEPVKDSIVLPEGDYYNYDKNGIIRDHRSFKDGRTQFHRIYNQIGQVVSEEYYNWSYGDNKNSMYFKEYENGISNRSGFIVIDENSYMSIKESDTTANSIDSFNEYAKGLDGSLDVDSINKSRKLDTSKWSFAVDFGSHYLGFMHINSDEMSNLQHSYLPYYVDFYVAYNRLYTNLKIDVFKAALTEPIYSSDHSEKSSQVSAGVWELTLGYDILKGNFFRLIPYGGIANSGINLDLFDNESDIIGQYISPAYGVNFDFKIEEFFKTKNDKMWKKPSGEYSYLRLNLGVYPDFFKEALDISGDVIFMGLAWGIYSKHLRVKK